MHEFIDDNASFVASGVAFRVALAVFPSVALLVWVGTRLLGPEEVQALLKSLSGVVPRARLAFAVWSTNGGMWALFDAMTVISDRTERRSTLRIVGVTLLSPLITLVLFTLVTGPWVLLPALLPHAGLGGPVRVAADAARWSLSFAAIALSLLFRHAPDRERDAWPLVTVGSTLRALLPVPSSALNSWVTDSFADRPATHGALGTVVSFLPWLWISFLIALGAAELDPRIEVDASMVFTPSKDDANPPIADIEKALG